MESSWSCGSSAAGIVLCDDVVLLVEGSPALIRIHEGSLTGGVRMGWLVGWIVVAGVRPLLYGWLVVESVKRERHTLHALSGKKKQGCSTP